MFNKKKRERFMKDLNLINRKLDEKTPIYMVNNGITIFNKKVSVLFKITKNTGTEDCSIVLGDINTVAKKYHEIKEPEEFANWIIVSAMQYGNNI